MTIKAHSGLCIKAPYLLEYKSHLCISCIQIYFLRFKHTMQDLSKHNTNTHAYIVVTYTFEYYFLLRTGVFNNTCVSCHTF